MIVEPPWTALARRHVRPRCTCDADVVDGAVLPVAAVLDRDRRASAATATCAPATPARGCARPGSSRAATRRARRRTSSRRSRPAAARSGRSPAASAAPAPNPSVATATPSTISTRRDDHTRAPAAADPLGALPLRPRCARMKSRSSCVRRRLMPAMRRRAARRARAADRSQLAIGDRLRRDAPARTATVALSAVSAVTYTSSPSTCERIHRRPKVAERDLRRLPRRGSRALRIVELRIVSDASFSFGTTSRSLSRVRIHV